MNQNCKIINNYNKKNKNNKIKINNIQILFFQSQIYKKLKIYVNTNK